MEMGESGREEMSIILDIHCHILPRVDDGPHSLSESLAMIRKMAREGITHVVATPHCNRGLPLFRDDILPHVARLNEAIEMQRLPVKILPGSEISLYDTARYRELYADGVLCHLGDNRAFSLLEFPWRREEAPQNAVELVAWLREQGTTPIVAHPERTPLLREDHNFIQSLVEAGAWLQITVDSLLGVNSGVARVVAEGLLRQYSDIVLATDSHNLNRCSGIAAGCNAVRERFGDARADDLLKRSRSILQSILPAN